MVKCTALQPPEHKLPVQKADVVLEILVPNMSTFVDFFTRTKSSGILYRSLIGSGEVMLELSHFLVFFTAKSEM